MTNTDLISSEFQFQRKHFIQYLYKIGYYQQGSCDEKKLPLANYETLCQLMECHLNSIPFGSLDFTYLKKDYINEINKLSSIHLTLPGHGFGVDLSLKAIFNKLILNNREGCCYEHTLLFKMVLEFIGFECLLIMVKVNDPRYFLATKQIKPTGALHVGLLVLINDKEYYVDVGFAPLSPSLPLELGNEEPILGLAYLQNRCIETNSNITGHKAKNLTPPFYEIQYRLPLPSDNNNKSNQIDYSDWKPLLFFYRAPCDLMDIELMNSWLTTHPNSIFRNHIVLSKFIKNGQIALHDNEIKIFQFGFLKQKITLKDELDRRNAYKNYFDIDLDEDLIEVLPKSFNLGTKF